MLSLKLGDLLRILSPNIDLKIAESIELKLGLESIIRIDNQNHFHFPISVLPDGMRIEDATGGLLFNTPQALLLPAPPASTDGGAKPAAAVVALSNDKQAAPQQSPPLPFRQCAHYYINQQGWWETGEQIVFGGTRIVPLRLRQEVEIFRPYQGATRASFWARFGAEGELDILFPQATGKATEFQRVTHAVPLPVLNRVTVMCARYEPTACVIIGDRDNTVFSFDPALVSVVWVVTYADNRYAQTERYLLVGRRSDS